MSSIYKMKSADPNTDQLARENCPGCGRSFEQLRDVPAHQPEPNETESNRCNSRPKKYAHLRCMFAEMHECAHRAKVAGTGAHFWQTEAGS